MYINGFYLYFISAPDSSLKNEAFQCRGAFAREWCEVATYDNTDDESEDNVPNFFQKKPKALYTPDKTKTFRSFDKKLTYNDFEDDPYKVVNMDIDVNNYSDRREWGTLHHYRDFHPSCAFELELRWMVGTGSILDELVQRLSRNTSSLLHLLPVPGDAFALPETVGSDPLRGPIFVRLNVDALTTSGIDMLNAEKRHPFEDFDDITRQWRLQTFQEHIIKKFGFTKEHHLPNLRRDYAYTQYVHCTGGMFVMIADINQIGRSTTKKTCNRRGWKNEIKDKAPNDDHFYEDGFLWSWNFMLTKRTPNTGDEVFQDLMLADFRRFCANEDNRLTDFWKSFQ